jgi:hypothetical protein
MFDSSMFLADQQMLGPGPNMMTFMKPTRRRFHELA